MFVFYTQWVFKNAFDTQELLSVHLGPVKYALVWPHAWNFPGSPSSFLGPVICTIFPQFCSSLQKLSSHGTPLQSSRAHLINRKLVPVKPGNWHQMQLVLSLWGVLNSCFLKFFFSVEAEILKIVIGMPRFIVLQIVLFYKLKVCGFYVKSAPI